MFFKKFLNQPNLVGTVLIALMVFSGFVYAFAFDGFNVETATGGEVEAWLAAAGGGGSGGDDSDPPGDDDREEGEEGTDPCDCYQNLPQNMHTHADCSCGNQTWFRPRKSGKKKTGGFFNPCNGLKDYPCSPSNQGGSLCTGGAISI